MSEQTQNSDIHVDESLPYPPERVWRAFLDHEGFDLTDQFQQMAHRGMDGGWRSGVLTKLVELLDSEPVH